MTTGSTMIHDDRQEAAAVLTGLGRDRARTSENCCVQLLDPHHGTGYPSPAVAAHSGGVPIVAPGMPGDRTRADSPGFPGAGPDCRRVMTPHDAAGGGPAFHAHLNPRPGGNDLAAARDGLHRWLVAAGVPEPDLHEILIAAGEACTNAVEHSGARPDGDGPAATVQVTCDQQQVRVLVADRGSWKEPTPTTRQGSRGRGRMMMAALMDHAEIRTGPTGTTVELVKNRDRLSRH